MCRCQNRVGRGSHGLTIIFHINACMGIKIASMLSLHYCCFSRPIVEQYGLWDQLRVDQGKEWYLMLSVQEDLAHLRFNTNRAPHLQTSSKLVCFT